jgi:hypothetical protein
VQPLDGGELVEAVDVHANPGIQRSPGRRGVFGGPIEDDALARNSRTPGQLELHLRDHLGQAAQLVRAPAKRRQVIGIVRVGDGRVRIVRPKRLAKADDVLGESLDVDEKDAGVAAGEKLVENAVGVHSRRSGGDAW